ncbi:NBAS subunit of NRZ tethering complex isoform X2 [Hydra vulgaris]|uniref:NBAS subunit of NRZ tethering complex isoform X2 n=1 Tax=Hydra vulgaris TaxID=6087 RepID=A0ABM4BSQ9_HYDVU
MDEQILYDLIVHDEWVQDPVTVNCSDLEFMKQYRGSLLKKLWKVTEGIFWYTVKSLKLQLRYQTSFGCPPHQLAQLINKKLEWSLSVSSDGSFLAVLQEDIIEIRTLAEDFSTVIGNCKIEKDICPQWRKIAWSSKSSLISYSSSYGDVHIFDLTGTEKCVLLHNGGAHLPGNLRNAISCLFFIPSDEEKWTDLLFVMNYQGNLKVYNISEAVNYEEKFSFSFTSYHPYGIASAVYDPKANILIVAGCYGKEPYESNQGLCYGSHCAISVWRYVSDHPFLTFIEDRGKAFTKVSRKELIQMLARIRKSRQQNYLLDSIYKICLSSDSSTLVSLHLNGRISLWQVPSMKLIRTWNKSEQPISGKVHRSSSLKSLATLGDDSHTVVEVDWWSPKELILACANGNLTISSIKTLSNLLGDLPERFDPYPVVSHVVAGCALILECDKIVKETAAQLPESPNSSWLSETDDDHSVSIKFKAQEIVKQALYFLTEAERFQPSLKKPRILTNVYRLICLKSTTPEELFSRKIEQEHYGEALELALRFKLGTDPVYQAQWRKKPVSKITIHDYLTKVKDRFWVLDECLLRVASDFDSTEELIKYGLLGTSWEVLQNIDSEKYLVHYPTPITDDDDVKSENIFSGILSPKQMKICKYRLQLLHYLDRLSTYEVILGGSFKARDKFNSKFFSDFRSCNIVYQAVQYAHEENSYALEDLFSYHGDQILVHWLPILSNFPETADAKEYEPLIPELGEAGGGVEILPWLQKRHRDKDWVQQKGITEQIEDTHNEEDLGAFIYKNQPELLEFMNCNSKDVLQKWFHKRIFEIDERSKQVDCCLQLTNIGIARGIHGLKNIQSNLETLRVLVYEVNIDNDLALKEIIDLPHISKMKLLMTKTTDESFISDYKALLNPYLQKVEKKNGKLTRQKLVHQFMIDIAVSDLTCCLKLVQNSTPGLAEPLIADVAEIMRLAMDCVYSNKRHDQLHIAFSIVECLPAKEEGCLSQQIQQLHIQMDQLELLLSAAEILQYHNCPKTVGYLLEIKDNFTIVNEILHSILKNTSVRSSTTSYQDWNTLLKHTVKLCKTVFLCVDESLCHQVFAECLLQSGSMQAIGLAGELLTKTKQGVSVIKKNLPSATFTLSYETSVDIVLAASQEYFNAAASVHDSSMEHAKFCLSLISDCPEGIQAELNLIQAAIILHNFGVSILPLQVRLCVDRIELIDLCLQKSKTSYKKVLELQALGNLLQICGDDHHERDGKITLKIAESSFYVEDFTFCATQCLHLIDISYSKAWQICKDLGESTVFNNNSIKLKLMSFALTFCPVYHIEDILKKKIKIDKEVLCEQLHLQVTEDDEVLEDTMQSSNQSLIKHTKKATKKFLQSMGSTNMLSKAFNWVKQSPEYSNEPGYLIDVDGFLRHPFYYSLGGKIVKSTFTHMDELYPDFIKDDTTSYHCLMLRNLMLNLQCGENIKSENQSGIEALQNLAELTFSKDSLQSISYMLHMQADTIEIMYKCIKKNLFAFLIAAYCHALQFYCENNKLSGHSIDAIYKAKPLDVIRISLVQLGKKESFLYDNHSKFLISNLTNILDMLQAQMLHKLGKGVDVERFTMDNNYKKETILGLAMTIDEEQMNICLLLAQKYDVQRWEVMLSFVEHIFTDSGLKPKAIRDLLNKWDVEEVLKGHNEDVLVRFQKYIYPEIDGSDHNKLLLFYVFALNCTSPAQVLEGNLTLNDHVKLLKKIKAAGLAINYRNLVHSGSPLDVIKHHVKENNVHLLSKIAAKIVQVDGTTLSPNKVFLEYAKNEFWTTKNLDKLDWIHRFEACQKIFPKLELSDIIEFSKNILFSELSVISLTNDLRQEIAKRILKFLRQLKGQIENNFKDQDRDKFLEAQRSTESMEFIISHLESINKVKEEYLQKSSHSSKEIFVRKLDMSEGSIGKIELLCSEMIVASEAVELIGLLAWYKSKELNLRKVFCNVLQSSLQTIDSESGQKHFLELVHLIKVHNENNGNLVTVHDILEIVRSFCSDINTSTHSKTVLLQLLDQNIDLTSEDMHMLMYFQSDSIIAPRWNVKIDERDLKEEKNRYELFIRLIEKTEVSEQIAGLKQLLLAWPPFVVSDHLSDPWLILICKQIFYQFFDDVAETIKIACFSKISDCYKHIYEKLCNMKKYQLAFKVMLLSNNQDCIDFVYKENFTIKEIIMDDELFGLIMDSNSIHLVSNTPLFQSTVSTLIQKDEKILDNALQVLRLNEQHAEAASIKAQYSNLHPSLRSLNNALEFAKTFLSK